MFLKQLSLLTCLLFFSIPLNIIYLLILVRGLSLAAASGGYTLVAVRGLLIASASLAVEHTLQGTLSSLVVACGLSSCSSRAPEHRLNSCGTRAWLLRSRRHHPGPEIETMSPALAAGFLTTEPPGKPLLLVF